MSLIDTLNAHAHLSPDEIAQALKPDKILWSISYDTLNAFYGTASSVFMADQALANRISDVERTLANVSRDRSIVVFNHDTLEYL